MKDYKDIESRAEALLERRGISGHRAAVRFVKDFKAYLIYLDATGVGEAEYTLSLLEDDSNLTNNDILYTNFRCRLSALISQPLREDQIFPKLFSVLMDNNGKGIGGGELALPLILSKYRFSTISDGVFNDNETTEVKKGGASLKPVKRGVPGQYEGLADVLNKKYWNGTVPGMKQKNLFEQHLASVTDPVLYASYFEELYVGCDIGELCKEVIDGAYLDCEKFNTAVGKFALKEYKRVDGWTNIIFIDSGDPQKGPNTKEGKRAQDPEVVNIADVNNIEHLNISFAPKMSRRKDVQAIADGYVNVKI